MQSDPIDVILAQWRAQRPELDTSPFAIVSRILLLYRELEQSADEGLARVGLTLWQFDVLSALRRSGPPFVLSPTQLVNMVTLSSGAMTNRIDRLEAEGWVVREPDPDDRRGVLIRLTPAGRRLADHALPARLKESRGHLVSFTRRERVAFAGLLRRLLREVRSRPSRGEARPHPDRKA